MDDEHINFDLSKDTKKEKPEIKKKILAVAALAVIFIIIGIGLYFYSHRGIPGSGESPETTPETVSSGKPLPPLSEQPAENNNITEKPLPPLSEVPEGEKGEEKPLPPLSE